MGKKITYILFIILLVVLAIVFYQGGPKRFNWNPSYSTSSKEPMGNYVFDKLLQKSLPEKYEVLDLSIIDLCGRDVIYDVNLLIIAQRFDSDFDLEYLLEYVEIGGNALIASYSFGEWLEDSLKVSGVVTPWSYRYPNPNNEPAKNTFTFTDAPGEPINVPVLLSNNHFEGDFLNDSSFISEDITARVLATDQNGNPNSIHYAIGDGNLILVCNPMLFTNYGILSNEISPYIQKHLAYLADKPIIRTEYYLKEHSDRGTSRSIFEFLLNTPPLKWAFYLLLLGIAILMLFTAKRKQKIIPVVTAVDNKQRGFIEAIANLYLKRNSNSDIIMKKRIIWGNYLAKKYGIDIVNEKHDTPLFALIAQKTGSDIESVRYLFGILDTTFEYTAISDEEVIETINLMNNIN